MPKPDGSLSAVVVSGGKQYRVAPGDEILVDRLQAEPGSSLKLGRVLLVNRDGAVQVGTPSVEGVDVEAKVIAHRRGPRVESLRYKSKKRVRVHRGGRADLTALSIISIGGATAGTGAKKEEAAPRKADAKPAGRRKAATVETTAGSTKKKAAAAEPPARTPRRSRKE